MARILIGTSGWVYPHWRGRFYPVNLPLSRWLAHFSAGFPTVEINSTFYRLPRASTFTPWRKQSADGFILAVKGSRFITHIRRLRAPADPIRRLMSRAPGWARNWARCCFSCRPGFEVDLKRLEQFLKRLPRDRRFAMEFRDASWHTATVYDLLSEYGVAYCVMAGTGLVCEEVATTDFIYVRFHAPDRGGPAFGRQRLRAWADRIDRLTAGRRDAYVYFNNDAEGAAISDAQNLREFLDV